MFFSVPVWDDSEAQGWFGNLFFIGNRFMSENGSTVQNFKILALKQAHDSVQALESRGDFRFRGIQSVYNTIVKWTEGFNTNGVLASFDQINHDSKLPEEKIKEYLRELAGRGTGGAGKVIAIIPAVQFLPGSSARLDSMATFCRPTETEQGQVDRYIQAQIQKSAQAVGSWIQGRKQESADQMRETLLAAIAGGKLPLTRARATIARLFKNEYDVTDEDRIRTNQQFVKPVLKILLDQRRLVLLKGTTPAGESFTALFFNQDQELNSRAAVLIEYFINHIAHQRPADDESELDFILRRISEMGADCQQLPPGEQQVVQELLVLAPRVKKAQEAEVEKERHGKLEQVVDMLHRVGHVVDVSLFRDFSDETIAELGHIKDVLITEYIHRGKITGFYLHRNRIHDAIGHARELFDRNGDDSHVQILSGMGLEKYLDRDHYKAFVDLEQKVLFEHLPFFVRLWRALFGQRKLSQKELVQIKTRVQKDQADAKVRIRKVEAAKERKKLASKRMQDAGKDESEASANSEAAKEGFGKPEEESDEEKLAKVKQMEAAKERMRKVLHVLDEAWAAGTFPNRENVLRELKDTFEDENDLVMFLKKHGRKEIFSFRIPIEKPEYVWPVLVTRRYLKKNGKSLYNKYQEMADKQRKAEMPNQELFDIASAVELFLGRILPKI
ncbi:MAG: hypothetical protein KDK39_06010 [Leptospiraceae bacterium]|nr:hypothetical protein [Leptospiraceae bacterium]